MKSYLDGNLYYMSGETAAVAKSLEFLEKLSDNIQDETLKMKCDEVLKRWKEAKIV